MGTRTAASGAGRPLSSSTQPDSPRQIAPLAPAGARLRLAAAKMGDHPEIRRFLLSVFHGPSPHEFQAQLDEPGYQPADRLVVKHGEEIVAHVRVARQTIQVGWSSWPAARLMDLATAPEYRGRGLATALVAAAERAAVERGALVVLTRTSAPALFARLGWSACGGHLYCTAAPRAVLAELSAMAAAEASNAAEAAFCRLRPPPDRLIVRPMRRMELPAIARLYEESLAGRYGWPIRSETYWEWLLARGACDRIYVAAKAPEPSEIAAVLDSIVGYAFVRQCCLVELITSGARQQAARALLGRVCADASEQDDWLLRCHLPAGHPLQEVLRRAGGSLVNSREQSGEMFMSKLLDPLAALRRMSRTLAVRAGAGSLPEPLSLGIDVCGTSFGKSGVVERYFVAVEGSSVEVTTGVPSRHWFALRQGDLAPLLLGCTGSQELAAAGRLKSSTALARNAAAVLFPGGPWWRPPLDDLLA